MMVRGGASDADLIAQYEQRFAALKEAAAQLDVAPEDAGKLIEEILIASLRKRAIDDIDTWLAAELRAAVNRPESRA